MLIPVSNKQPLTQKPTETPKVSPGKRYALDDNGEYYEREDIGQKKAPETETVAGGESGKDRHETWKATQKAARVAREAKATEKAVAKQALAADALRKGDISTASNLLGMTVQELLIMTQNAALSLPTEKENMSDEQRKAKEEADLLSAKDRKLEQMEQRLFEREASDWIKENLNPVLQDTDKFELINQGNAPKIKRAIFDYVIKHWQETAEFDSSGKVTKDGERLDPVAIAEEMEATLEKEAIANAQKISKLKKLKKYFAKTEEEETEEEEEPEEEMEATETEEEPLYEGGEPEENEDDEEEKEEEDEVKRPMKTKKKEKAWALMSQHERDMWLRKNA